MIHDTRRHEHEPAAEDEKLSARGGVKKLEIAADADKVEQSSDFIAKYRGRSKSALWM